MRTRLLRSLKVAPLALLLALTIGASATAADPVEINVLLNPGTLGNEYLSWLEDVWIPVFEEENPNIKVNIQLLSGNRLDVVATAVAGGVSFDIVDAAHTLPMIEGVGRDWYLPLDDYIAQWDDAEHVIPTVWPHVQWEGKTLALPHHVPPRAIAYNKQLFEMAGLDRDTPPSSWEEFLEYARRLTRTQGDTLIQRGYYMLTSTSEMAMLFELLGKNNGIRMLSEDYREPTFNVQRGIETLNFMKDLYDTGNPVGFNLPNDPVQASFLAGNTAMIRSAGAGLATTVSQQYAGMIDLGIFLPRRDMDHTPVSTASINSMAIMRFTQHPDEAWKVLEHLYAKESLEQVALLRGQQIPRLDVLPTVADHSPEALPFYDILGYLVGRPKWPSGGGYTYTTGLGEPVRDAVFGTIAPEMALDEAERRIELLLNAFWSE